MYFLTMESFIAILTIIVAIIGLVSWILILIALLTFFRQMQNVEVDQQRNENVPTVSDISCE